MTQPHITTSRLRTATRLGLLVCATTLACTNGPVDDGLDSPSAASSETGADALLAPIGGSESKSEALETCDSPDGSCDFFEAAPTPETGHEPLELVRRRIEFAKATERELGVTRDYQTEFDYVLVPPASLKTPKFETSGALTWRYDGQATFNDQARPLQSAGDHELDAKVPGEGALEEYFGVGVAERVDNYGRLWILDSVDKAQVEREKAAYDREVEAMFGRPEVAAEQEAPVLDYHYPEDAGEVVEMQNTSWGRCYCGGYKIWDHSGDALSKVSDPMNDRNKKVLWAASAGGSATLVRSDWALTAAHVVSDAAGNALNPNSLQWCSMENLDENTGGGDAAVCNVATSIQRAPGWPGPNNSIDPADDYAVVGLSGNYGNGWFAISQASDNVISSHTDRVRGTLTSKWGCNNNLVTSNALTTNDTLNGAHLYGASGSIQSTPGTRVKWDTSTADGISGGPHFYCPNGGCVNGHYLTGVQAVVAVNTCSGLINFNTCAGNSCLGGYATGPKGSSIRTWVLNNTP